MSRTSARIANLDKALRLLRERQGLNQSELADSLGVAVSTVSSWERGTRLPSLPALARLADRLDLDLGDLDYALDVVNGRPRTAPQRDSTAGVDLRQVARQLAGGGGALGSDEEEVILHLLQALQRTFGRPGLDRAPNP